VQSSQKIFTSPSKSTHSPINSKNTNHGVSRKLKFNNISKSQTQSKSKIPLICTYEMLILCKLKVTPIN